MRYMSRYVQIYFEIYAQLLMLMLENKPISLALASNL